ncbi:MAG: N-acetyl-gamma-glutamyl-phosphate reductase [Desulfobulbus propionicus]|nr:MAG: N-acetyl-gamma-glutamyl-phosphate reductase [Desulfobulbus propionicus]
MLKVGIIGASGYTGAELARIITTHPEAELTVATSRKFDGQFLAEVFPSLRGKVDLRCENLSVKELVPRADFFFTAVPHKTAMDIVPVLLDAGKKVVDLSADYRIHDQAVYEKWYQEHSSAQLLAEAVYGLPERYRNDIKDARLTANPGCYPTSAILALAPLLERNIIDPDTLIIDSKSGATGAGRSLSLGSHFCEVTDGFRAYKIGGAHRHIPEIEQELSLSAGKNVHITFTPHLLPVSRGILTTAYGTSLVDISQDTLQDILVRTYQNEPFVRVLPSGASAATQYVRGSNYCDLAVHIDKRASRIIIVSVIDNVVKGASGQAIQNMNIMNGFDERAGLSHVPLFP